MSAPIFWMELSSDKSSQNLNPERRSFDNTKHNGSIVHTLERSNILSLDFLLSHVGSLLLVPFWPSKHALSPRYSYQKISCLSTDSH